MQMRSTEESRANVEEFCTRYIKLLQDKKALDEDIKALKNEYKENGVPVGIVAGVINRIKAAKKKTDSEVFEEETIRDWLESNVKIDDAIGSLND